MSLYRNSLLALATLVGLAAWSPFATAAGDGHTDKAAHHAEGRGAEKGMAQMFKILKVTPEQKTKMTAIHKAANETMLSQHEKMRGMHEKQMALLAEPSINRDALDQLRKEQLVMQEQVSRQRMQIMLDVAEVLTPEQRKKWAEHMQKKAAARQHGHEGMGPSGPARHDH
jgi:protein CpxP